MSSKSTRPKRKPRPQKSSLAIVEKAHRGTLEDRYGNIVWLSECTRQMKADHNIVLAGPAVTAAFDADDGPEMSIADMAMGPIGQLPKAVRSLKDAGAQIWVLQSDLDRFAGNHPLVAGVEVAPSLAALTAAHDHVWFW